jgi:ABC-2 type transport system ATP-binding protein
VDYKNDNKNAAIVAKSDIRDEISGMLYKNNVILKNLSFDATTLEDAILTYYNEEVPEL